MKRKYRVDAKTAAESRESAYIWSVRRIVLLSIAGLASAVCFAAGCLFWKLTAAGASHSLLLRLTCIFPVLSLAAFALYFFRRAFALVVAWLLLTGEFLACYLLRLQECARQNCSTADSLRVAWSALTGNWDLWLMALASLCLLLDYSAPAAIAVPSKNQDAE